MSMRSPYDFLRSPYDSRTMLGVRLSFVYYQTCTTSQYIMSPCGDRRVSVRRPYDDATYDVSTGYGLTIFKNEKVQTTTKS